MSLFGSWFKDLICSFEHIPFLRLPQCFSLTDFKNNPLSPTPFRFLHLYLNIYLFTHKHIVNT